MSTKLQYGQFNDFGRTTTASDLSKSGKWNYAAQKIGLQKEQVDSVFDYWQNSSFMKGSRYAQGLQGLGKVGETSMQGPLGGGRTVETFLDYAKKTQDNFNAFEGLQAKALQKRKLDFSVDKKTGVATYYDRKMEKQWQTGGPLSRSGTTNKAPVRMGPNGVPVLDSRSLGNQGKWVQKEGRGQKYTGRMLNNTFVEQSAYDKMSETDRKFYGLSSEQAYKLDPSLKAAGQVVGAAHQYRQGRSRKKTGIGAAVGMAAPIALGALGGIVAGPLGAAIGSGVQSGFQGGDLSDIAMSAGTGYLGAGGGFGGGMLGQTLAGAAGSAIQGGDLGQILSGGLQNGLGQSGGLVGAAANTSGALLDGSGLTGLLGAATENGWLEGILGDQLNSGGNMSVIGDIWNNVKGAGSGALDSLGGLGDLLKGGYDALGGAKGIVGGLGDILSGGGGDLIKGVAGYYSNKEAARTQQKANDQAIGLADPNAQYKAGYAGQLNQLMKNPALAMQMDPSAKFRFNLGEEAVRRKAASTGNRFSGAGRNASQEYGQQFASQEFGNQVNRLHTLSQGNTAAAQVQQGAGQNQADSKIAQYDVLAQAGSKIGGSLAQILSGNTTPPPTQSSPYTFNPGTAPPQNWGQWG